MSTMMMRTKIYGLICHAFTTMALMMVLSGQRGKASEGTSPDRPVAAIVIGAPGADEYREAFALAAAHWRTNCEKAGVSVQVIDPNVSSATSPSSLMQLDQLKAFLDSTSKKSLLPCWIVLIGHGTFDGQYAKFNLTGPDLAADELALWLAPFQRPLIIINSASSSGPFINHLSGTNRVIVTATKSGYEQNLTRFGTFLAENIANPEADLDKDDQTSLLEAFLAASRKTAEFYETEGRLATEHALIDDNGDGLGSSADWFRGIRPVKQPESGALADGLHAHQIHLVPSPQEKNMPPLLRARRDQLEVEVEHLRQKKTELPDEEYYRQLEALLLQLAHIYSEAASAPAERQSLPGS